MIFKKLGTSEQKIIVVEQIRACKCVLVVLIYLKELLLFDARLLTLLLLLFSLIKALSPGFVTRYAGSCRPWFDGDF
jgi:hypothetical protein